MMKCSMDCRKRMKEIELHLDHAAVKVSLTKLETMEADQAWSIYDDAWKDVQSAYDVLMSIFAQLTI